MDRRAFLRKGASGLALGASLGWGSPPVLGSPPSISSPPSPRLLEIVQGYADTLLEKGRDNYGEAHTPLVAAALDQKSLRLPQGKRLTHLRNLPRSEWGIRQHDRVLTGANPMHDQNLYQVLYALTEATGEARYRAAADEILETFFSTCQHETTGLLAWGEHAGWNFRSETFVDRPGEETEWGSVHEFFRPWVLWDRSFELAPEACRQFAEGLWNHQIADQETGNFSRHARIDRHDPDRNSEYPRHGGFYIATWAHAYEHTGEEVFLRAIRTLLEYFNGRRSPQSDALPAESAERSKGNLVWPHSNLGLAIDLHRHADKVPAGLAERMRSSAARTDDVFLQLDHRLDSDGWGFVKACHTHTLAPGDVRGEDRRFTTRKWATGYGDATDARIALICSLRYQQTHQQRYRRLILDTADRYLQGQPNPEIPLYPGTIGHVLLLEMLAADLSGKEQYSVRAQEIAEFATRTFWRNDAPLPRASSHHAHYEAITRADTLVLAVLKLWERTQDLEEPLSLRFTDR